MGYRWFELLENVHPMFILPWQKEIIKKHHKNTKKGFPCTSPILVDFQTDPFHYEVVGFSTRKLKWWTIIENIKRFFNNERILKW